MNVADTVAKLEAIRGPVPHVLILDWETFYSSEVSVKTLGVEGYVRHPEFQIIGVGLKLNDEPSVWLTEEEFRAWAEGVPWARVAVVCHNTAFDAFILAEIFGIHPGFLVDTMSMARLTDGAMGVALAALAQKYRLGKKGDELKETKGLRLEQFPPDLLQRFILYCLQDVDLTHRLLKALRARVPKSELWAIDTTLRMGTQPQIELDQQLLMMAAEEERAKKRALLLEIAESGAFTFTGDPLEGLRAVIASRPRFRHLLERLGVDVPLKAGKRGLIPAFGKDDPGFKDLLNHSDERVQVLCEARVAVTSRIVETRAEKLAAIGRRGRLPVLLRYCGAHTHRFSGDGGVNLQNLNRKGPLRRSLMAPPGHVFVVADSGQIEARVNAWNAGEAGVLETFRRNDADKDGDFYSDEGSHFFGYKLSKKDTPNERQVAKILCLALGYSMGLNKLAGSLLAGFMGAPPVQFTQKDVEKFGVDVKAFTHHLVTRVDEWDAPVQVLRPNWEKLRAIYKTPKRISLREAVIHWAVSLRFLLAYRERNARIARNWKDFNNALPLLADPRGAFGVPRARVGKVEIMREAIRLPSGLVLHYDKVNGKEVIDPDSYTGKSTKYSYTDGREWKRVYGGLLTENVVQSMARDIIVEQMLAARAAGLRVVTTTHDEIVCVVPERESKVALETLLTIMRTPPHWCADLPLNADGGIAARYGDAKP